MNIKKIVKEIKRGNNPIVLKDVVDGVTYYHTIMYVQLNDRQITTTVWGVMQDCQSIYRITEQKL